MLGTLHAVALLGSKMVHNIHFTELLLIKILAHRILVDRSAFGGY
jgi:hypothetical protein